MSPRPFLSMIKIGKQFLACTCIVVLWNNIKICDNKKNIMRQYLWCRSGKISVEELKSVCNALGTPITEQEIAELLKE